MKKTYVLLISLFILLTTEAQTTTKIVHYSVDNGLSENHVLCMLQDHKGFMWFGTFNGLNKFDGCTFRNFKGREDQKYQLVNFRINRIEEDKQGFLWIQTNDGRIFRFNPTNETFLPVPQCIDKFKDYKGNLNRINILPDGSIWLRSNSTGYENCFRVQNINSGIGLTVSYFFNNKETLAPDKINKIFLDKNYNTWILTSKGVDILKMGQTNITSLSPNIKDVKFNAVYENSDNLYFGGERGKLLQYSKKTKNLISVETPITGTIADIQEINEHELLLLTDELVFYLYDIQKHSFKAFKIKALSNNKVYGCYKDRDGNIWIDTDNSTVVLFDAHRETLHYIDAPTEKFRNYKEQKFYIVEDVNRNIWVQLRTGGFYKYNKELQKLEAISSGSMDNNYSDITHTGYTDKQGNLWISTYLQGVDKVVFEHSMFQYNKPSNAADYTLENEVRAICQDKRGWLWIGTKKGSIYIYDKSNKLLGKFCANGAVNGNQPLNVSAYDIKEDHTGTVWIATKGSGLLRCMPQNNQTFKISSYQYQPENSSSISSNDVYSVFEDRNNRIWIGTFGGGLNLTDSKNGKLCFLNFRNKFKEYPIKECSKIRYVTDDNKGNLFACTTQGLLVFQYKGNSPENLIFKRLCHLPGTKTSVSGNDVQYILPSRSGDLYLAVTGGVINVLKGGYNANKEPEFEVLKNIDGSSVNGVYTLKEDTKGNIWMSGQTQVFSYNPSSQKLEMYKPLPSDNYFFEEAAVCQSYQGEIIYGISSGFISYDPLKICKSAYVPPITFTQLQIFNKPIYVGLKNSPLEVVIDNCRELKLNHKQNNISIEYAALDFQNPEAVQYAYKLEGLDNIWKYVGSQRIANFINLPKGKYVFHVKSTNADGEWVNNERTLVIFKYPSFWESGWGILFYIMLFILFSLLTVYILFTIYRLRNEIDVEKRIANLKLRFFTDISHELRTPLTLITAPVEYLLRKENLSATGKEQLGIVQRNTSRMLRLINQILDLRKVQNNKMKLIIEQVRVYDFLKDIGDSFNKLADDKKIKLLLPDRTQNPLLWVDKDKFEKIFYNLISNAFKFSKSDNEIKIEITENENFVSITVRDQGVGISLERIRLLFNRFESFATAKSVMQAGTGIGLSLTKELVELHHGSIEVDSVYGKGSAFKVNFKKGFAHFGKKDEVILSDTGPAGLESFSLEEPEFVISENLCVNEKQTLSSSDDLVKILVVEDNSELRGLLKSALLGNYEVYEAENGRKALDFAHIQLPDIIISDIMMPDMDGLEFTKALKSDINISHIPIILLTAKTDLESKLEAMELGVDDYITKPFSLTLLEARIVNLLKIRKQLQEYYKSSLTSGVIALAKPEVTCLDEVFIRKIIKYLEENFENSELSIDLIAETAGVSRSSFFKKIKSLTGLAPVDFVREFRLQKAAQLMDAGETNVSQIAYNVGIIDPKYFRKCFKLQFGINPSEYIGSRK